MMPPLVSVVIVNWNGREHLERCLGSLVAQAYPAVELILVDNDSRDDSVAWVAQHFPVVRLICNTSNLGFAAGTNRGIDQARGAYIALLNNDAWVEPNWVESLVAAIEAGPRIGMVASKMVYADRPQIINSTGICVDRCGITWDRRTGQADGAEADGPLPVFGSCAGAALYRRELFDDVGRFDEDFFMYLEDVDLAWRARWRGWLAVYAPTARVYHVQSGSSGEGSPAKTRQLAQNKIWLLVKNYPWPHLGWCLPLILFYEALSLGFAVWRGRGLSALQGRWRGWRGAGRAWQKRRRLLARATVSAGEIFKSLEPARWPWQVVGQVEHVYAVEGSAARVR